MAKHSLIPDAKTVLAGLARRRPAVIDLSLDRMVGALEALGNPHHRLPPVFHVAGTNGKGSTIAYLRAILEASGKSVHVYTSPHLVRFHERIVIAGREIDDAMLVDIITRCDRAVDERALTYFEAVTCAAFLAFAENPADALLLEVGLGGRLDATNVVARPAASIITPVALDHQHYLGDDLATIAGEKAGIFRAGVPAIIGPQNPASMAVLEQQAVKTGALPFKYGEDWNAFEEQGRLVYQDEYGLSDLALPRLVGAHQVMNAGLAVAVLRAIHQCPEDIILSQGIASAQWPARMQPLRYGPHIERIEKATGEAADIWLDGGHNPHAARALATTLADLDERLTRPVILIAGLQQNKDLEGYFEALAGLIYRVYVVKADLPSAAPLKEVKAAALKTGHDVQIAGDVATAMRQIADDIAVEKKTPRIVIGGSLYLAGEVLVDHG